MKKLFLILTFSLIFFLPSSSVFALLTCECCCPTVADARCDYLDKTGCTDGSCCGYCKAKGLSYQFPTCSSTSTSSTPTTSTSSSAAGTTWEKADKIYYLLEAPIGSTLYVDGIAQYITLLYNLASSAAAIIAVVVIMFGGFMWATSAGNEQRITSAKETIVSAVVGLILVLGSYVILNFINPQLVSLAGLDILKIPLSTITSTTSAPMVCEWKQEGKQTNTFKKFDDSSCSSIGPKPIYTASGTIDARRGGDTSASFGPYYCYCVSGGISPDQLEDVGNGILVAKNIATQTRSMLKAMGDAGINVAGSSGYRSIEGQVSMRQRYCNCTTNECIYSKSTVCSRAVAIPGTSNHQYGNAIDFSCKPACFTWLSTNAKTYGFYNLPSESWHWSTTGG